MVTSAFALFSHIFVTENEQELYCQTISMGKVYEPCKRAVCASAKETSCKLMVREFVTRGLCLRSLKSLSGLKKNLLN